VRSSSTFALLSLLVAALAGCADHAAPDLARVPYRADPPPFYADSLGGPPMVLGHPYPCYRCGWIWWK
jgi:hypothetical protein